MMVFALHADIEDGGIDIYRITNPQQYARLIHDHHIIRHDLQYAVLW